MDIFWPIRINSRHSGNEKWPSLVSRCTCFKSDSEAETLSYGIPIISWQVKSNLSMSLLLYLSKTVSEQYQYHLLEKQQWNSLRLILDTINLGKQQLSYDITPHLEPSESHYSPRDKNRREQESSGNHKHWLCWPQQREGFVGSMWRCPLSCLLV